MTTTTTNACVLCGDPVVGHGHNPAPLATGRCCDACNSLHVLPARLGAMVRELQAKDAK